MSPILMPVSPDDDRIENREMLFQLGQRNAFLNIATTPFAINVHGFGFVQKIFGILDERIFVVHDPQAEAGIVLFDGQHPFPRLSKDLNNPVRILVHDDGSIGAMQLDRTLVGDRRKLDSMILGPLPNLLDDIAELFDGSPLPEEIGFGVHDAIL